MKAYNLQNCARCGLNHTDLEMKAFTTNDKHTHYATCPTNGEPILITIVDDEINEEIKLDQFHYHEFVERAHLMCCIIEEIANHPVRSQIKEIDVQVDKVLAEAAELYQVAAHHAFDREGLGMPDIRNKLTPMNTLAALVAERIKIDRITYDRKEDDKLDNLILKTLKLVEENVEYISNLKL